ncbi:hypothetical protein PR202_ga28828 [Eleusine coracana subsp. coracana]|uniref:RING-type E3 ubiquitin transferase n=1 Tax=Eleusine coracana subsp. coracana TaxID=191504 RepID=A0AAV5DJU8_ELECO|nr:hypothetical protein PR202_ga28828 [Eleusine coracana subsp. coracana]
MKFTKKYQTYMKEMETELPGVGLKRLKKMLKKCRSELSSHQETGDGGCPGHCSVCDGSFFPCLLDEMSAVVGCFNEKAKKLLELHLASGFKKYTLWFTNKSDRSHRTLIKQGKDLIHYSKQGQEFKAQAQSLHIEILQSPWLCELMAFYMNLRRSKKNKTAIELFSDCSLIFDDERPTLTCNLFDSMRVDISLTCSICLEGVFPDAVHLDELNMLLSHSCPEYWEKRLQSERVERVRLAKEHWESQCRAFLGI